MMLYITMTPRPGIYAEPPVFSNNSFNAILLSVSDSLLRSVNLHLAGNLGFGGRNFVV